MADKKTRREIPQTRNWIDMLEFQAFNHLLQDMTNKEIILTCNQGKSLCKRINWRFLCITRFGEKFRGRNVDTVLQEMHTIVQGLPRPFVCREDMVSNDVVNNAMACKCFYYWTKGPRMVAWGSNQYGQLGVPGDGPFTQIACGDSHSVALTEDGRIKCWGDNRFHQLYGIPRDSGFIQIACGAHHSVALNRDGTLRSWGFHSGDTPTDGPFTQIACGHSHSVALRADGTIVGWGRWLNIPTEAGFTQIACGTFHAAALKADGTIRCWGRDRWNMNPLDMVIGLEPGEPRFTQIACGDYHSVALTQNGKLYCWGSNYMNAMANWELINQMEAGFTQIACGTFHSVALTLDGRLRAWGSEGSNVPNGDGFIQIACNDQYSIALKADGTLHCWGRNGMLILTFPPRNVIGPIACGRFHAVAQQYY